MKWLALLLVCACQPPTFTRVQREIFEPSCNFSGCHGNETSSGLVLVAPSYAKLIGVASTGAPDRILVAPGDPASSFLYEKLSKSKPEVGDRMPQGLDPLPADRLSLVHDWIAAGAKDD